MLLLDGSFPMSSFGSNNYPSYTVCDQTVKVCAFKPCVLFGASNHGTLGLIWALDFIFILQAALFSNA